MRNLFLIFFSIILFSCTNKYDTIVNSESDYHIIPKPQELVISNGRFLVKPSTKISIDEGLMNESDYLVSILNAATGYQITTSDSGTIKLKLDASIENEEGYKLTVTSSKIILAAKTSKGIFYGIQSLRQLMPVSIELKDGSVSELTIPSVEIIDNPRFGYRGMHLDVARHFFGVEDIKKYIDLIAMHKMNTFHWHLTEDQGWRIEIKKYPKLTEIGSVRKETLIGHGGSSSNNRTFDGKEYGGFYTQEEVKEIVAYATTKHITIIPEIELPGHASAAIAAYPELGNTGAQIEVVTRWGVFYDIYAPKEETFQFLEDVLTEVIELFPSKFIHIGGDEAPKTQWEEGAFAQEVIKREGLKDEHELQSYFIGRIEKFLNSKGRDIIGWDEILEGGLAPNATVMSWRGEEGGIEAAKQHHNVIMTPNTTVYFDYYQVDEEGRKNEELAIGGYLPVEKVYSYEPIPEELSADEQKYILGAQGNLWTEYVKTYDRVEYMVLPRLTALSEVVWTQKELKDYNDFKIRLNVLSKRYDALEINYAKHILED